MNRKRILKRILLGTALVLLLTGVSISAYIFIPLIQRNNLSHRNVNEVKEKIIKTQEKLKNTPNLTERLIIPKINLDVDIFTDGEQSLNKGVWLKYSDRSNPILGGNTILTGHRFGFGTNIFKSSPLYNVDLLEKGDTILFVWKEKIYGYMISDIKEVKPTDMSIEKNTNYNQLTLYTCTLEGAEDGRIVILASPILE